MHKEKFDYETNNFHFLCKPTARLEVFKPYVKQSINFVSVIFFFGFLFVLLSHTKVYLNLENQRSFSFRKEIVWLIHALHTFLIHVYLFSNISPFSTVFVLYELLWFLSPNILDLVNSKKQYQQTSF